MATIKLYGSLKCFGDSFQLSVKDTAEAIKALCVQLPNFRQALMKGYFKVRIGKDYLDNRYLEKGLFYQLKENAVVHITPVVKGAKKAGVFQVIVGVVLMVASIWTGGATFAAGLSMTLGGVAQMLTKTPQMNGNGQGAEKKQSTAFSNLQNMVAQGRPVPLAYGKIRVGSLIISQGIETFDTEVYTESPKPKKAGFGKGRM